MNALKTTVLSLIPSHEGKRTEGKRTIVAMVSASIISLVVWGLVVVLNVP